MNKAQRFVEHNWKGTDKDAPKASGVNPDSVNRDFDICTDRDIRRSVEKDNARMVEENAARWRAEHEKKSKPPPSGCLVLFGFIIIVIAITVII